MNAYATAARPQTQTSPHRRKLQIKGDIPTVNRKAYSPQRDSKMEYKFGTLKTKGKLLHKYNPVTIKDYISPNYAHGKSLTQPTLVPNSTGKIYQLKLKL